MSRMSRSSRKAWGPVLMFGSAAVMLFGLFLIYNAGGMRPTGMLPWAWAAITILGLIMVHGQTMAMAMIVSLVMDEVTDSSAAASSDKSLGDSQP